MFESAYELLPSETAVHVPVAPLGVMDDVFNVVFTAPLFLVGVFTPLMFQTTASAQEVAVPATRANSRRIVLSKSFFILKYFNDELKVQ